ncbi:MAG: extracellular solute-binding protein [Oscillospiraceae bacterium]|nr:extracellular solute-binding protein [Oscillospiraceae bacterium]
MKNKILRSVATLIAMALIAAIVAGCNRNGDGEVLPHAGDAGGPGGIGTLAGLSGYVFVPEFITIQAEVMDMSHLTFSDGRLYFTSWSWSDDMGSTSMLYSMDIDGTNVMPLANYSPAAAPEGAMGSVGINALNVDVDGNLWVAESGQFWGFDLPDDREVEPHEMWQYQYEIGQVMTVRKLDRTGSELLSLDISELTATDAGGGVTRAVISGPAGGFGGGQFFLQSMVIDGDGNIYLAGGNTIHVLHNDGSAAFSLEVPSWVDRLIRLPDGTVAFFGFLEDGFGLRTIDFAARTWGESIDLPSNARNVFPGGYDYSIIFSDGNNLVGIESDTGEIIRLLNWIDSDVQGDDVGNIVILPDGRILGASRTWNNATGTSTVELIVLTKMPYDSIPERAILTLATFHLDWQLRSAIINFNRTNSRYRIQVNDFAEFNTEDDWNAGLTRLTTELIAGRVPDMLGVSTMLPFHQYVSRGLIADLYLFVDSDPQLSRTDLMESVFQAMEIDGGLYQVFTNFNIQTLAGRSSVVGSDMGWTISEFRDVLRANPQADVPLGQWMTRNSFLQQLISMNMNEFVDWSAGTSNFDSDNFIQLLELAYTFPAEIDFGDMRGGFVTFMDDSELIAEGRQIVLQEWISDFRMMQMTRARLGGDAVFKGFPTESRNGHALSINTGIAITSTSENQQGAWEFVRTLLTADWQRENIQWGFPTNSVVFNERLEEAMTPEFFTDADGNEVEVSRMSFGMGDLIISVYAMSQDEADQLLSLIGAVSGSATHNEGLMNIISEGTEDFFSGRRTAQDAARIIQSRASILIAEQS